MLRSIGWQELAIILVIVLLLFGPKRLPQLGKMFGKTMRNVREGMEGKLDDGDDDDAPMTSESKKPEKVEATSDDES